MDNCTGRAWSHGRSLVAVLAVALVAAGCARGGGGGGSADAGSTARLDAFVAPGLDGGVGGEPDAEVIAADGAVADDGAVVPEPDAHVPELCVGVDCSALDGVCTVGRCDAATGACASAPRADGDPCDDGDPCTTGDACASGACAAGAAVDCSATSGPCATGACNASTGACEALPAGDGTSCDADATDCVTEACSAGACVARPTSDCIACGAGGTVCAAGACGAPPDALVYDFESGLPGAWSVGGSTGWVVDATRAHGGTMAAHSGAIGHGGTSTMTASLTLATAARFSFWFYTSTESGYDWLEIYVDSVRQARWSGANGWTQGAVSVGAGAHAIEMRYVKDGSASVGDDRVWIDDVRVEPAPPAIDFEGGALPAGWTTSGTAGWSVDTSRARGGSYGARSGAISHSQQSSLHRSITLASAATLSFWYSVSSESSFDYLEVWIDGTRRDRWSGEVAWTLASYALAAGAHTVEWRYVKDGSVHSGSDRAWIDDVQTGESSASTGPICGG